MQKLNEAPPLCSQTVAIKIIRGNKFPASSNNLSASTLPPGRYPQNCPLRFPLPESLEREIHLQISFKTPPGQLKSQHPPFSFGFNETFSWLTV